MIEESGVDLTPLRPDEATRRRVLDMTLRTVRDMEASRVPPSSWTEFLEVPARHVRWLVPLAAALWILVWMRPAPVLAPSSVPAPVVQGAPSVTALTAAWGVPRPPEVVSEAPLALLARFAERKP